MSSKSNASDPAEPLISSRIAFLRPYAKRVASNVASPPPDIRPRKIAASSTVTGPVRPEDDDAVSPLEESATGRSCTNVSSTAETPVTCSPVMNCARSTMCAPMSPSAPEPAFCLSSRQDSGAAGSAIQSCRYCARTCRTVPIRPSATRLPGELDRRHAAVGEADHRDAGGRPPLRRPSPRPRRPSWPAASRTARACPPRAPRSRSRRACHRACRRRRGPRRRARRAPSSPSRRRATPGWPPRRGPRPRSVPRPPPCRRRAAARRTAARCARPASAPRP